MKKRKLDRLKEKFLQAANTENELIELQKLLQDDKNPQNEALKAYLNLLLLNRSEQKLPINQERFFSSLYSRQTIFKKYRNAAAAAIVFFGISLSLFFLMSDNRQKQKITKQEIDQSLAITNKALTSFSAFYQKGLEGVNAGMDISKPIKSLSNIETTKTYKP